MPLTTSEIQGDLQAYLEQSEQIPSLVVIAAAVTESGFVTVAGGLLIQTKAPQGSKALEQLRERLQELPPLDALLSSGQTLPEILDLIFATVPYETMAEQPLQFYCSCSRERSRFALITLGSEDVQEILNSEGEAVIDCHFCHERYIFNREELQELLSELADG